MMNKKTGKNMFSDQPGKGNAPVKRKKTLSEIVTSEAMQEQWQVVLPKCLTPDRLARVAVTQIRKTPKLAQCDQGSVLSALMTCAELGIEPNGRQAHLIPYGQECQLIIDYKGLVELAMRSGKVSRIHADVVCESDRITIKNGLIDHEINPLKERGKMVGAYAICLFKDATEKHEYMSKAEIDSIRARSKAGKSGPWVTDYNEMAKKTVFRRMSKWLPLSSEIMDKIDRDDDRLEYAVGMASGPAYARMETPALSYSLGGDAEPAPDGDDQGEARETEKNEATAPVEQARKSSGAMNKVELIAAIESHKERDDYEDIRGQHMPLECELSECPKDCLLDILNDLEGE